MTKSLFDLSGKVTLVTGGNSGIGLGFARGFAKCGADVVIWGRNAAKNATAAEELRGLGAKVLAQAVDVTSEEQVRAGMREAVQAMGRLDCVFANAGISSHAPSFIEMETPMFEEMLRTALFGGFYTLREAARHMVERSKGGDPGGSLIVCGSLSLFLGVPGMEHYAAAKGGLSAAMRSIALEMAPYGIRANMVAPGYIKTMLSGNEEETDYDREFARNTPMRRNGTPADFEGIAAYLASDVSSFHTGDVIVIDGGFMVRLI